MPQLKQGFVDSHFICFPYESRRAGIYPAAPVRRPMDIAQSMEDATGATMKAIQACTDDDAWDKESGEVYVQFIDPLDTQLRKQFDDMTSGRYEFQHDLPFMAIVQRSGRAIPFRTLLETINRTHRNGV